MFKIVQPTEYTWPISVEFPTDGGRTEKASFDGVFARLTQTRITEIKDLIEKGQITDIDLAREVLIGWSGVVDDSGEVPFSNAAKEKLLDIPKVATAVVVALFESLTGSRRKN